MFFSVAIFLIQLIAEIQLNWLAVVRWNTNALNLNLRHTFLFVNLFCSNTKNSFIHRSHSDSFNILSHIHFLHLIAYQNDKINYTNIINIRIWFIQWFFFSLLFEIFNFPNFMVDLCCRGDETSNKKQMYIYFVEKRMPTLAILWKLLAWKRYK